MMDKLILGRYIPGQSIIHRLDPRAKLLAIVLFVVIIFLANNWLTYVILMLFVAVGVYLSGIKLTFFINGVKPLLWLILFTVALQVIFTSGETILFKWAMIVISKEGIINGLFIFMRFVLIIFMSTLLTLTTMPMSLTEAIEYLLNPFKKIGLPVHEIALMLSIALRFVPTLMDETEKIMNAQRARGVEFGEGHLLKQVKAIIPMLIPLLVGAINRAEELAIAMEARGYKGSEGRSKFRQLVWKQQDTILLLVYVVLIICLVLFRR